MWLAASTLAEMDRSSRCNGLFSEYNNELKGIYTHSTTYLDVMAGVHALVRSAPSSANPAIHPDPAPSQIATRQKLIE
jgi:hypothetical protein